MHIARSNLKTQCCFCAQEREAMANYHDVMERKQEEMNALAALEMAERQQREQASFLAHDASEPSPIAAS